MVGSNWQRTPNARVVTAPHSVNISHHRRETGRSVSFAHQQTTVFPGAPTVSGSAAVLLGDVDNDAKAEIELVVGGVDGTLAVFKAGYSTEGAYLIASGLGRISALGLGTLLLGHSDTRQLVACTEDGMCHIFNIELADVRWDSGSRCGRIQPLWSVPCPRNVTSCCIADVNGDSRQEVIVGTKNGGVLVLSIEVNSDHEDQEIESNQSRSGARGGGTASGTPRPGEDARSRPSTPAIEEDPPFAREEAEEWLAQEEDGSSAQFRESPGPREQVIDAIDAPLEDQRKSTVTPVTPHAQGAAALNEASSPPRTWSDGRNPALAFKPHFRDLLELTARGPVTSLSIIYFSEKAAVASAAASAAVLRNGIDAIDDPIDSRVVSEGRELMSDDEGVVDSHEDTRGLQTTPSAKDASSTDSEGSNDNDSDIGSRPGSEQREAFDSRGSMGLASPLTDADVPDSVASAAGVYVAVGLAMGGLEVMRVSSRRLGSRFFDLVDLSEQETATARRCHATRNSGDDRRGGGGRGSESVAAVVGTSKESIQNQDIKEESESGTPRSPVVSKAEVTFTADGKSDLPGDKKSDSDGGSHDSGPVRLETAPIPQEEEAEAVIAIEAVKPTARPAVRSWRVPLDVNGSYPSSLFTQDGHALVLGLVNSETAASAAATTNAAKPSASAPSGSTSTGMPRWRWGRSGEGMSAGPEAEGNSSSLGGLSNRGGGETEADNEDEAFAVCTSDGCVGCCRVVCTPEGLPQWRVLWMRQAEEAFFAFHKLDFSKRRKGGRTEGQGKSVLVACSFSGSTQTFDDAGTRGVGFDPLPYLGQGLAAFIAGDMTTASGVTQPSLVYVGIGGEVVVYHGISKQAELMGSPQFVNAIRENGSIAHLRCLVESLVERLRWRSNQTDLLFSSTAPAPASSISRSPPRDDGHTLLPPKDDKIVSSTADSIASATGSESLLKANDAVRTTNSRQSADVSPAHDGGDGEEHGLSLSGNILARAILCPEGISVALARAARKKNRSRATRTGDTAGGNGGSGDGFDTETWRREISAVRGGEAGTLTVGDGAAAAERVLKEIKAWEKDRDPTFRKYPCLRGTLVGLTLWGSGSRRESLRGALKKVRNKADVCAAPPPERSL